MNGKEEKQVWGHIINILQSVGIWTEIFPIYIILGNLKENTYPITGNQLNRLWGIHTVQPLKNQNKLIFKKSSCKSIFNNI